MANAVTTQNFRATLAAELAEKLRRGGSMAFGDGGHKPVDLAVIPPNSAQTTLLHELLRKPLDSVLQEEDFSVTGVGKLERAELAGARLSEAGLLDGTGRLIGVKNFSPKIKENDEVYEIKIKLIF